MNAKKSKDSPIWDFLADSIVVGTSQARLVAAAHPHSRTEIMRTHFSDTVDRLTRMLLLDARHTRTWLTAQDRSIQYAAVFAKLRASQAARRMTRVNAMLPAKLAIRRDAPARR